MHDRFYNIPIDSLLSMTEQAVRAHHGVCWESKRHAMAIVGIAHDDKSEKYFIMKNSWGKNTPYEGLDYLSFDDFRRSTLAVELPRTKPFVRHLPERQRRNSITPRIFSSSAKPTHMPTRP